GSGAPAGLYLARHGGWRLPFIVLAAMGVAVGFFAIGALPSMTAHIDPNRKRFPLRGLFARPTILLSYTMTGTVMLAGFLLVANFPADILNNLGYPRDQVDILYLVAGMFSFAAMRVAGRSVDRWGSFAVGSVSSVAVIALIYLWLVAGLAIPIMAVFIAFMTVNAFRNVAYNTLTSK